MDLIHAAGTTRAPRRPAPQQVRSTVQRVLDSMVGTPALVLNGRLDILAANQLGFALFAPVYANPVRPANNARFVFLDPHATEFFRDWDKVANDTVAILRGEAGRHPYDRRLSDLIGELSTRSDQFRVRWAAHDVQIHTTGIKLIHHPVVGDLDLPYESFPMTADLSQSLLTYTPEPGSPSHDALSLLASWAASAANTRARTTCKTGDVTRVAGWVRSQTRNRHRSRASNRPQAERRTVPQPIQWAIRSGEGRSSMTTNAAPRSPAR